MQVYSSIKLCCTDVEQSLVLSVLGTVLANATNLITLRINNVTSLDPGTLADYANLANFSFTASVSTYAPIPTLSTVSLLCILQSHQQPMKGHIVNYCLFGSCTGCAVSPSLDNRTANA